MNRVTKLASLVLLSLAALVIVPKAQSQQHTMFIPQPLISATVNTNSVEALSTNVPGSGAVIDISNEDYVSVECSGTSPASNTVSLRLDFCPSVTGSFYDTNQIVSFYVPRGTNAAGYFCAATNWSTFGYRSYLLVKVANLGAGQASNLVVTAGLKK